MPASWYRGVLVGVLLSGVVLAFAGGWRLAWVIVVLVIVVVVDAGLTHRFASNDTGLTEPPGPTGYLGRFMYWLLVAVLIVFGTLTGFSIGIPFLLVGLTLAALWPARRIATTFWPVLAGEFGLFLGFVLITPAACTTSSSTTSTLHTTCSNLIGLEYSGTGVYHPTYLPALLVATLAGGATAFGTWMLVRNRSAQH